MRDFPLKSELKLLLGVRRLAGRELVVRRLILRFQKPLWTFFSPSKVLKTTGAVLHPKINAQEGRKRGQSGSYGSFGALASVRIIDVMALDHPVERLAIDTENTRCRLLVSASVKKYAGDVSTFDFR